MKGGAVALDLGGVLVRVNFQRVMQRLSRATLTPQVRLRRIIFDGTNLKAQHDAGRISSQVFAQEILARVTKPISAGRLLAIWSDVFDPAPQARALLRYIRKSGARVFLFSNTDPVHLDAVCRRWKLTESFDGLAVSYELGVLKPDPIFFERAVRRVRTDPARTVFFDDSADNVRAAKSAGFTAFRACSPTDVLRRLVGEGLLLQEAGRAR